uniref:Uncharacterized protein n=1 Tax=Cacopsylla melanoneura TaxID=428564 RepID=A0A8D8S6R2_9HEMI
MSCDRLARLRLLSLRYSPYSISRYIGQVTTRLGIRRASLSRSTGLRIDRGASSGSTAGAVVHLTNNDEEKRKSKGHVMHGAALGPAFETCMLSFSTLIRVYTGTKN